MWNQWRRAADAEISRPNLFAIKHLEDWILESSIDVNLIKIDPVI